MTRTTLTGTILMAALALAGCGQFGGGNGANPQGGDAPFEPPRESALNGDEPPRETALTSENILTLFNPPETENTVKVNRYIWAATLEVLDFLPIQTIDPFTGVIVTGFGTPPGGGRSYRATVLIDDPALDARALNVALQSRGGPVSGATSRAIEDAILTRARQLRVADSRL